MDANFGQHPFVFDIEDYMREWRTKTQAQIDRFPIGDREGEWQTMIQKYDLKIIMSVCLNSYSNLGDFKTDLFQSYKSCSVFLVHLCSEIRRANIIFIPERVILSDVVYLHVKPCI